MVALQLRITQVAMRSSFVRALWQDLDMFLAKWQAPTLDGDFRSGC